jgi:hypothetical protein
MKRLIAAALILCSLTLALPAQTGDDKYEPNNSSSSARPLNPGRYSLSFSSGDEDWFSFRLSSPGMIRIYTESDLDTRLSLYGPDSDEEEAGSDDDGGEGYNARIALYLDSPGLYYIQASPYDEDNLGDYVLALERVELRADALEPNNSRNQARTLNLAWPPQDLTLFPNDDEDWFKLDLGSFQYQEGEILFLYTSGDADTFMELYRGDDKILENDDGGEDDYNARIGFSPEQGTPYYIRISGYEGSAGEYGLHSETEIVELDPYEPNDTRNRATVVSMGQTLYGNALGDYDAVDWFSFSITQPGAYAIGTTGGLDTVITLYTASGEEFNSDDDGGSNSNALIETYLEPGTYYAEISLYDDEYGEYSFFVRQLR